MDSKTCLFNRAKDFIYSPALEDLHIFSKETFNSFLNPYYSSNAKEQSYAAICIDYNKLNDINNTYSYATGDKIIHYSLSLMLSVLPSNSICARIGGDEFVFLINNCSPDSINQYINKIYNILKEHEKELLFCDVTAYGIHSSEKDNLSEMISEADLKITEKKNSSTNIYSHSKWEVLEKKLDKNLISFFKSLRLYKEPIDAEFLRKLCLHSISSCSDLLEHDFTKANSAYTSNHLFSPSFTAEELIELYNIFLNTNPSKEDIDNIDENTYSRLIDKLIHDPITGNFSKDYFKKYLLHDNSQKYEIKYISTAFIKLFNTIFSHNTTDIKTNKLIGDFTNYLQEEHGINFCNETFSNKSQNYFIALGAGDYLMALQKDESEKVDNSAINSYFSSALQNTSNLENILRLFCSKDFHSVTKDTYDNTLESLSIECKKEKDNYKISILDEPMIKDALDNIIYDSTEYYISNIPNSNDINNKNKFLHILTKTMLNISIDLNKEQENRNKENR